MEVPEDKLVRMVAYNLKGVVGTWVDQIQTNRRNIRELSINS